MNMMMSSNNDINEMVDPDLNNESSSNPPPPQHCNRRLSRAARATLVNRALPILKHYDNHLNEIKLSTLSFDDKMHYYSSSVFNLMTNPKTCLLNPQRDQYWKEERLHKTMTKSRNKRFPKQQLHVCGFCGKKFISKYYLDLHVDTIHNTQHDHHESIPQKNRFEICPANELCQILGLNVCEQQAIIDEPYYAPGIHKDDNLYSQSIKRKYLNDAQYQPCNHDKSIHECHEMFHTCFGDDDVHEKNDGLIKDLMTLFCDSQSCDTQLDSMLNTVMSIHDGREEWKKYQDEIYSFGWMHIFYIIFIVIYYFSTVEKCLKKYFLKKKKVWEKAKRS